MAVCSRRAERAHSAAQAFGATIATTDYRELVERTDVDAVIIATPAHLHHSMTMTALGAGKHVLCEKPMARTVAEAKDMVKMAERSNVVAMVNHEFRFIPARAYAKELIESGYIGEPYSASMSFYRSSLNDPRGVPFTWLMEQDKAGGMLGAIGSHHIDTLRWWMGDIRAASGALATMVKKRRAGDSTQMLRVDADDNFALVLQFENGAIGTIHYSATAAHEPSDLIVVSGAEGTLVLTSDGRLQAGAARRAGRRHADSGPIHPRRLGRVRIHSFTRRSTCSSNGPRRSASGTTQSPSFEDGYKVQEVIDAIGRSVQTRRSVELQRGRRGAAAT